MKQFISLFLIVFSFFSTSPLASANSLNLLVLHSYSPSYEWTMNIERGIKDTVASSEKKIRLSIEYMDSKRINNSAYIDEYINYLKSKYDRYYFDAIIVSDDFALNSLIEYGDELFLSSPIVAIGINNSSIDLKGIEKRTTVFYERDHVKENLDLAEKLFPNADTVYLLNDNSLTSNLIRPVFLDEIKSFPNFKVKIISDLSLNDAANYLSKVDSNSVAFLTHFNTEIDDGQYYDYDLVATTLSKNSAIPLFSFWEHYIGHGVLGGFVNRSYALGVQSVISLSNTLDFPIGDQFSSFAQFWEGYVFDYGVVDKFQLKRKQLPHASMIVNEPYSYLYKNRNIISVTVLLIFMMLSIIITQYMAILRKKELNKNKSQIVELQNKTLTVQKEMIEVLGEAIETRSGETGNHVRRVAKMSFLLGELYGLSITECQRIEMISPMHDVGKIGIPEAILDKPGKLTQEERGVIETHTEIGYRLLMSGDGEIMHSAARIALEHHERWDGKGYPNQLMGEDIHIFARITAITDVFDALMSKRCYKEPWPLDKVIELFTRECGNQFDPFLCNLFLNNIHKFIVIREAYPDDLLVYKK